jgi:hypothetical protein
MSKTCVVVRVFGAGFEAKGTAIFGASSLTITSHTCYRF